MGPAYSRHPIKTAAPTEQSVIRMQELYPSPHHGVLYLVAQGPRQAPRRTMFTLADLLLP